MKLLQENNEKNKVEKAGCNYSFQQSEIKLTVKSLPIFDKFYCGQ